LELFNVEEAREEANLYLERRKEAATDTINQSILMKSGIKAVKNTHKNLFIHLRKEKKRRVSVMTAMIYKTS
jgi:hypothetical protein